jgi:hypothetical protein
LSVVSARHKIWQKTRAGTQQITLWLSMEEDINKISSESQSIFGAPDQEFY